jgi:CSLREA domain-containing protein
MRSVIAALLGVLALTAALATNEAGLAGTPIVPDTVIDDYTVDGNCSLREAIESANTDTAIDACQAGDGDDVIELAVGTYTLQLQNVGDMGSVATGDLNVYSDLTIVGMGPDQTTIDANGIDRVMFVSLGGHANVSHLTMTGGDPSPHNGGSGIWVLSGRVDLSDVVLTGNTNGPALQDNDDANLSETRVVSNSGVGIFNAKNLTVQDSDISSNADQGLFNRGNAYVERTLLSDNRRGLENDGAIPGASADLANVTITGNSETGVLQTNDAMTSLSFVTISDNAISELNNEMGDIQIANSIVSRAASGDACLGDITSLGHNIDSDDSCGFTGPEDRTNADPLLDALADNGGLSDTRALLEGSPAIDAADPAACPGSDQRREPRPHGHGCDIGAFESDFAALFIQGDVNCDGLVNEGDLILLLQFIAGLTDGQQQAPCPDINSLVVHYPWGDANCDGALDGLDALFIALHAAALDTPDPVGAGCFPVGSSIT